MIFYITFSVSQRLTPFPHRGKGIFTQSVTIVTPSRFLPSAFAPSAFRHNGQSLRLAYGGIVLFLLYLIAAIRNCQFVICKKLYLC
jgi:hypothetical protein